MGFRTLVVPLIAGAALLSACGGDGDDAASDTTEGGAAEAGADRLTVGYSPWPGWFPLAVAQEAGIFEEVGLDVELRYFADYLSSLDAMAAGELDVNAQTLNDTIAAVAAGSDQVVVVIGDNSTGNDQIICDESIRSIADLEGRTIGAEAGVVDHFLLLQGMETEGLTEDDIDFRPILTADAAAAFAAGEFDCVGVYAPFTLQAMEREGAHVLFDSADFPGTIPDLFVATREVVDGSPEAVAKFVEGWYRTLDHIEANPEESLATMAELAELSVEEYESFAAGTTIFTAEESLAAFADGDDTTSILHTARLLNPFLVEAGLTEREADLDGMFEPSFTAAYVESLGG